MQLTEAVIRSLTAGFGRPQRCPVEELSERLIADGVAFDPDELSEVLARLADVGTVVRVQKQHPSPMFLVLRSRCPYDQVAVLAADVCAAMKRHGGRFESEAELIGWLDGDQVSFDSVRFEQALYQLESSGRVKRPRADHQGDWPLPGVYMAPRVLTEIL